MCRDCHIEFSFFCHPEQGRGVWYRAGGTFLSQPDLSTPSPGDCARDDKGCATLNRKAFTLIELLVVISVITLLLALLLPALQKAKNQARATVCQANLKQWGTTLNLYTEDNQGCFPRYDDDPDIVWFLRGSIARYDDPNEKSLRPIEARGIACCPMAVKRGRRSATFFLDSSGTRMNGWRGSTFEAWEITSPGRPFRCSYGLNGWLFCRDFDASIPVWTRWRSMPGIYIDRVRGKANIPVLLDSTYPYGHPGDWGLLPPRKEGLDDPWMGHFAINRHNGHVNGLFLDWSVRKVGIKELWTLKWHMQFNTANTWTKAGGAQPADWPKWMRGFKDY